MEKMDLNASFSASSSASTGLRQQFQNIFGDNINGGGSVNRWIMPVAVVACAVVAIVWLLRR